MNEERREIELTAEGGGASCVNLAHYLPHRRAGRETTDKALSEVKAEAARIGTTITSLLVDAVEARANEWKKIPSAPVAQKETSTNDGSVEMLTIKEVSGMIRIGDTGVRSMIRSGVLKAYKLGGCVRISRKSVDSLLRGSVIGGVGKSL